MIFEEKIRLKKYKIQKFIEENVDLIKEARLKEKSSKNEKMNENGVSENSELRVNVVEAFDLRPMDVDGFSDPYVVLSLDKDKQMSTFKRHTLTPIWNEEFFFKPKSRDQKLIIEVYDKDEFSVTDDFEGMIIIPLKDLESQKKIEDLYDLEERSGSKGQGQIHLKLHFTWSNFIYYQNLVQSYEKKIEVLEEKMTQINKYFELFQSPFGMIYYGGIDNLYENNILDESFEHVRLKTENNKMTNLLKNSSLFPKDTLRKSNILINSIHSSFSSPIIWTSFSIALMGVFLGLTIISLLERSDFLNVIQLILALLIWIIFYVNYTGKYRKTDIIKSYWKFLFASAFYDLAWFFFHEQGVFRKDYDYETSTLQKFSFFVSLLNIGAKIVLIILLFSMLLNK